MLRYIEPWSPEFDEAIELRHEVLYSPFGLDRSLVTQPGQNGNLHLVAFVDGRLVGHARLASLDSSAEISEVAVAKRSRKKGVGTVLVQELLRVAATLGKETASVDAWCDSARFFEKLGFEPVGDIFASPMTGFPCRRMVLALAGYGSSEAG